MYGTTTVAIVVRELYSRPLIVQECHIYIYLLRKHSRIDCSCNGRMIPKLHKLGNYDGFAIVCRQGVFLVPPVSWPCLTEVHDLVQPAGREVERARQWLLLLLVFSWNLLLS